MALVDGSTANISSIDRIIKKTIPFENRLLPSTKTLRDTGASVGGQIDPSGRFQVADAPLGDVRVTVTTSHLKPTSGKNTALPAQMSKPPADAIVVPGDAVVTFVEVDPAFESVDTTKLTATVKAGDNSIDFSLD